MSNLVTRTLTGIVFLVLVVGAIILDKHLFSLLFLVICVLGLWEFYSLVESARIQANKIAGTLTGAFLFISNALIALHIAPAEILLLNFLFIFLIFLLELYRNLPNPFTNVAFTFFGLMYVAVPFSLLNYFPNPAIQADTYEYALVLGFFVLIWVNESGAYLVGSSMGRHKLFERISPKKTWEGTLGGGLLTLVAAWIISMVCASISFFDWLVIALIVVVFGSYGDLFESMFKRSINAKDSGRLLPGHGGILDRFDGVLIAAPFVFVYLVWIA